MIKSYEDGVWHRFVLWYTADETRIVHSEVFRTREELDAFAETVRPIAIEEQVHTLLWELPLT